MSDSHEHTHPHPPHPFQPDIEDAPLTHYQILELRAKQRLSLRIELAKRLP